MRRLPLCSTYRCALSTHAVNITVLYLPTLYLPLPSTYHRVLSSTALCLPLCSTTGLYLLQSSIYHRALSTHAVSTTAINLPHAVSTTTFYLPPCYIYHCALSITFISSFLRHRLNKLPHKSKHASILPYLPNKLKLYTYLN